MTDYKEKYRNQKITTIMIGLIGLIFVIFLSMNIKLRDEEIWKLRVENEDLKERISETRTNE